MITFSRGDKIGLVRQPEHARLSEVLSSTSQRTWNEPVNLAIRHHDDGWSNYDEFPKIRNEEIVDYRSTPLDVHLEILTRSVQQTLDLNPYAGWLVSRHGCSFHEGKTGTKVKRFLKEQRILRKRIERDHNLPENGDSNFNWLQFADALSLYVLDPWSRELNWNRTPPGNTTIIREETDCYRYNGAGYEPGSRTFTVDCKYVPAKNYADPERLRNEFRSAATQSRTITIECMSPSMD